MVTPSIGRWTWQSVVGLNGPITTVLDCAQAIVNVTQYPTLTCEGLDAYDVWGNPVYNANLLPVIYDQERRLIPYRQTLQWTGAAIAPNVPAFTIQQWNASDRMYSPTHHLELRFLDFASCGAGPYTLTVDAAAVLMRINQFDPLAFTIDGLLVQDALRSDPFGGVRQDWPPVYDSSNRVIPYRQQLRIGSTGAVIPKGALTLIEIVPN